MLQTEKLRKNTFKELAEEQQKKTKKYKLLCEELKNENAELKKEIKKLNLSHPNQTITEEKKEYSDLLGDNNNSGNEELFVLKKNNKMLKDKLDEEINKTEVLKVIAEKEKIKIEKIINQYKSAQEKNNELINKLKKKDLNFNKKLTDEIKNLKKNNDIAKEKYEIEKSRLQNQIKELNQKINELQNELNQKKELKLNLNCDKNTYNSNSDSMINENNNEKNHNENNTNENNDNSNNNSHATKKSYARLISVQNIETKEDKEENSKQKDEGKITSFDFFEKRQMTGRFGGFDDENNVKSFKEGNISNDFVEEKDNENEEDIDEKKEDENKDNRNNIKEDENEKIEKENEKDGNNEDNKDKDKEKNEDNNS